MKRLLPLLLVLGAFFSQQSAQAQGLGMYVYGDTIVVDDFITINDSLQVLDVLNGTYNGLFRVVNQGNNPQVDSITYCLISAYSKIELTQGTGLHLQGNYVQLGELVSDKTSKMEFYGNVAQSCAQNATSNYKFGHLIVNTPEINMSNDLTIMPGGKVEFGAVIPVRANVVNLNTGKKLIMEADATQSAEFVGINTSQGTESALRSNYINSTIWYHTLYLSKTTYDFPVGDATSLNYMKLDFPANAIQNGGIKMFTVTYGEPAPSSVDPDCDVPAVKPYTKNWEYKPYADLTETTRINAFTAPSDTYTITLNPRAFSINQAPERKNFTAYFLHTDSVAYKPHRSATGFKYCHNSIIPGEIIVPAMQKFSKVIGVQSDDDNKPFPSNNITLNATGGRNNINVGWQVEIPREVAFFNLERSTDGRNFQTIQANITAESSRNGYGFTDRNVKKNQTYFYRVLVSTTTNEAKYTRIVQAKVSELGQQSANLQTNLYPNPTDGSLNLEINAGENETVGLKIVDAIGRIVIQKNLDVENGTNRFDLTGEVMKLTGGTYNLVLTSESGISTTKLVKN